MARPFQVTSVLQLPDEVLHRIWHALPVQDNEDGAPHGGSKGAWRLCCRRMSNVVLRSSTTLRWQPHACGTTAGAPSCGPAGAAEARATLQGLLERFSRAGGALHELDLACMELGEPYCEALSLAALQGELQSLRSLRLAQHKQHRSVARLALGMVLSRCSSLVRLDLSCTDEQRGHSDEEDTQETDDSPRRRWCSVCTVLQALPPAARPLAPAPPAPMPCPPTSSPSAACIPSPALAPVPAASLPTPAPSTPLASPPSPPSPPPTPAATFSGSCQPPAPLLSRAPSLAMPVTGLRSLLLQNWDFDAQQLTALRDALLHSLTRLRVLDLKNWDAYDDSVPLFVGMVRAALASGTLTELNVQHSRDHYELPQHIQAQLALELQQHRCTLTVLSVWDAISKPSLLAPVLRHNCRLQELSCGAEDADANPADLVGLAEQGGAAEQSGAAVLAALSQMRDLTCLELSITPHSYDPAALLRQLPKLRVLRLYGLSDVHLPNPHAVDQLAAALRAMPDLTYLELNHLASSHLPMSAAVTLLRACPATLTQLALSLVTPEPEQAPQAISSFGAALRRLTSLQELSLYRLAISAFDYQYPAAIAAVASALPHLTALTTLDVGHSEGVAVRVSYPLVRAGAVAITGAASLLPALRQLRLPSSLKDGDRVLVQGVLQSAAPRLKLEY